ncbi:MAG: HdeD family acid-resistance protein, partial [Actinobacteria bacterium]|nr:HdeD family acid-resistance protein [Actinomycetota bacterium]
LSRLFACIANPGMPGRGFTIFSGVITIIAAIVVLASPLSSLAVLVWITGIWLIVLGVLEVVAGLFIKRS